MPETTTPVAELRHGDIVMLTGEFWHDYGMGGRIVTLSRRAFAPGFRFQSWSDRPRYWSIDSHACGVVLLYREEVDREVVLQS